jgi:hypothetical protein
VFCDDNPVNFTDPFGLCRDDDKPAWEKGLQNLVGIIVELTGGTQKMGPTPDNPVAK